MTLTSREGGFISCSSDQDNFCIIIGYIKKTLRFSYNRPNMLENKCRCNRSVTAGIFLESDFFLVIDADVLYDFIGGVIVDIGFRIL